MFLFFSAIKHGCPTPISIQNYCTGLKSHALFLSFAHHDTDIILHRGFSENVHMTAV